MLTVNSLFHAVRYGLDKLHYESMFLKVKQYQVLESVLKKRDTIAILPTGYGKSILFHLLPFVYDYLFASNVDREEGCAVLVISPLNALIEDQLSILKELGVEAVVLKTLLSDTDRRIYRTTASESEGDSDEENIHETQTNLSMDEVTRQNIKKGTFKIIFAHPEAFISCKEGRWLLMSNSFQQRVIASVIDEAHLVEEWGAEFRPDYRKLDQLGSIFPQAPFLALTATAPEHLQEALKRTLHLDNPRVIVANLNRPNIFIEKTKRKSTSKGEESYESILLPIAQELKKSLTRYPLTIIYLPLRWCGYAYKLFSDELGVNSYSPPDSRIPENCLFAQYHSPQTEEMKLEILSQLQCDDILRKTRVVFATVAIGIGVNISDVRHVVHIGVPGTIEAYYQEIGRAGRDGKTARASLYYNGHDIASNKPGMTEEMRQFCQEQSACLRNIILKYLGSKVEETDKHLCCSNCLKSCSCSSCHAVSQLQALPAVDKPCEYIQPFFNISDSKRGKIRTMMRRYRETIRSEGYHIGGVDSSTGLTLELIDLIVNSCEFIKSANEMFESFEIWDAEHANILFSIITEVCEN